MAKRKHPKTIQKKSPVNPIQPVQLDIVIPVLNGFDMLQKCLDALPKACGFLKYNVIIIDNCSEEEKAQQFYGSLPKGQCFIFRFDRNMGFPFACNYGAGQGRSDFLLFLNSDCYMEPGSIQKMWEVMVQDAGVGVLGPKLLFPEDSMDPARPAGKIQHAGIDLAINSQFVHMFIGWESHHPKANIPGDVTAVTGASMMVRRDLFTKVNGFFEGYGRGTFEDLDLCYAAHALGYKVWYHPEAVGYHVAGGSQIANNLYMPLSQNHHVFISRWQDALQWTASRW